MRRRPFKPTPLAVALQTASLAVIAGGLFGILIGDITIHRAKVVSVETKSQAQLFALPHEGNAKSR
jgi:Na+/glutamate symporter